MQTAQNQNFVLPEIFYAKLKQIMLCSRQTMNSLKLL